MRISAVRTCNKSGYTLVELAVVILLIGIVTLAVMPRIAGLLYPGDLKKAAREVIGAILLARTEAVTEGKSYYLFIDLSNQYYWMLDFPGVDISESDSIKRTDVVLDESVKKRVLPGGIKFLSVKVGNSDLQSHGVQIIRCFPLGVTDPAIIHIGTDQRNSCTLVLDAFTGEVEVKDGYTDVE